MRFDAVIDRLERRLSIELPGALAHALLAPLPRRSWPPGFNPARVRHAAGLLLLFPDRDEAHVVLTVRADSLGRHSGQVSLPGGAVDPGESFEQAALREAHEEIALGVEDVRVLGPLTPIDIPVSGFRLHPIVAVTGKRPALKPSNREVARILEIAVDEFLAPEHLITTTIERDRYALTVPAFHLRDVEIWGATAMVMSEFLALLGWAGPPQLS